MADSYKIKGIISAERPCELCGNNNLEKNVVLEKDGELLYVGSDCAGKLLYGVKKAANTRQVKKEAEFIAKCQKWLETYPAEDVKKYIDDMTCNGQLRLDRLAACGLSA